MVQNYKVLLVYLHNKLNENYYLDLDEIDNYISIPNNTGGSENHISVVKYDMVK